MQSEEPNAAKPEEPNAPKQVRVTGETVDMLALALALRRAAGENFEAAAGHAERLAELMLQNAPPVPAEEEGTPCQS